MHVEMCSHRRRELLEIEERRIASRLAIATGAAIALALTGVVATATALRAEGSFAVEALATAPLPLSVVAGAWAFGLHVRLGEIRGRKAEPPSPEGRGEGTDPEGLASRPGHAATVRIFGPASGPRPPPRAA